MPDVPTPSSIQPLKNLLIITLGLVFLIIGGFSYFSLRNQRTPTATNTTVTSSTFSSVPKSYTDFTADITAIDRQQVSVHFTGTNDSGQMYERDYVVHISPSTALLQRTTGANGLETSTTAFDTFHIGDTVAIVGDTDLAAINEFTATKIIRY